MASVDCKQLLRQARQHGYAVGYFEAWDMASLLAIIRAAELARAPVMTGFCGAYLARPRRVPAPLALYAQTARMAAQRASVPVALLLNECTDLDYAREGVKHGFDMVMFVDEALPVPELTRKVRQLSDFAHASGVAVEAEVGVLGEVEAPLRRPKQGLFTDPEVAAAFIAATGVDALAVSIGSTHFLERGKARLDLDLLERLHSIIPVPLVLHGGTGVAMSDFPLVIERGICKVNIGTALKRTVLNNQQRYFAAHDVEATNPNDVLGRGGDLDLLDSNQSALIDVVLEYLRALGGENQAP